MDQLKRFILVVVVAAFSLAGCGKKDVEIPAEKTQYRIGAILPLTGPIAYLGEQELVGLKLAVEDINTRAPSNGFTVSLQVEDFESQPANAVTVARKLIDVDKADALFVSTTSATRAVAPIAQAQNMPVLAISSDPAITSVSPSVYRIFMNSGVEQKLLAERLKQLNVQSVYVLYDRDRAFEAAYQELQKLLAEKGITEVSADTFEKTQSDFRVLIEKAKKAKAQAYVLFGFGSEFPQLLSQWQDRGKSRFFGNYTFGTTGAQTQGLALIEGIEFPSFAARNDSPALQKFVQRAITAHGGTPFSDFMDHLYSYESLNFLEQCIKRGRESGAANLIQACSQISKLQGASGEIQMDNAHNALVPMQMSVYRDGKLVDAK